MGNVSKEGGLFAECEEFETKLTGPGLFLLLAGH